MKKTILFISLPLAVLFNQVGHANGFTGKQLTPVTDNPAFSHTVSATQNKEKITYSDSGPSRNTIGFFQSYDNASPELWYFNGQNESLSNSGYTILIDAFWVNYPFCWNGSPVPTCQGIVDKPGPGTSNTLDADFWTNYSGAPSPTVAGPAYNKFWTSLHTSGPQTMSRLRTTINKDGKKIKLLASIGGWNMGGSAAGKQLIPSTDPTKKPAWAALLQSPSDFAAAMNNIVNLKENNVTLYDGIDIDIETLYGEGCATTTCTRADEVKAINDMVTAIRDFKKLDPTAILSISPRAADLACDQQNCSWNNAGGVGFVGEILNNLAHPPKGQPVIYFDEINPQFYNDNAGRNIPSSISGGEIEYGNQVVGMLKKIHDLGIIGPNTSFNIGVLAQTNNGQVDTGGASMQGNPGVPKALVKTLWNRLHTDPAIVGTGIKINGLMCWAANLALGGTGIGGNVRSSSSPVAQVVPYNWGAQ